jgi:hypothetical protein
MALLPSPHATRKTVGEIEIAIFVENCDDQFLTTVGDFHLQCGAHASIYVAG